MKTIIVITLSLFSALSLSHSSALEIGSLRIGHTPATSIAKDCSVPGKYQLGKCLPYAIELNKRLQKAGIASQVIGYHYQDFEAGSRRRGHAVVAFEDGGRTYIMDNQSWSPRWVENAPTRALAQQFEGMDTRIVSAWKVIGRPVNGSGEVRLAARIGSRKSSR